MTLRGRAGVLAMLMAVTATARASASGPDLAALEAKFDAIVRASRAPVGVALIHVESGGHVAIHGDQRFPMASVYKLPIAVELLSQISEGTLTPDRSVPIGPSDIRACCTLSRRHPKGGIALTAGELLALLLDLMARAKTGPQRLKALLPPDTIVAHKTGTTDVVINDAGIITLPGDGAVRGHLAIAVFVMNGRVAAMQTTIARLAGAAFEFFSGRPLPVAAKPKAPPKTIKRAKDLRAKKL